MPSPIRHGSLFSGIDGFSLAAQVVGWENVFQVENDAFCKNIEDKRFPNTDKHGDIREFDGTRYRGAVEVISGGFPCQPYSVSGKQLGSVDERALWPQMLRVIREVQPVAVLAENVPGIVKMALDDVLDDLEGAGYATQSFIVPACALGAWHQRDRVWIIAYSESLNGRRKRQDTIGGAGKTRFEPIGSDQSITNPDGIGRFENGKEYESKQPNPHGETGSIITDPHVPGFEEQWWRQPVQAQISSTRRGGWWGTEPGVGRVAHGVPGRVDRLKALGNAIVPQVAVEFFMMIEELIHK
jgi:DNA (cytosine-5)-methyltransferase 1